MRRQLICLILTGASWLAAPEAWGRLPKPIKLTGFVLAVDLDTHILVFKEGKGKKPVLLEWNKQTEFNRNGQSASAFELKQATPVVICYKDVSFHNGLLKRVIWEDVKPGQ